MKFNLPTTLTFAICFILPQCFASKKELLQLLRGIAETPEDDQPSNFKPIPSSSGHGLSKKNTDPKACGYYADLRTDLNGKIRFPPGSPNGGDYETWSDCGWVIRAPSSSSQISLTFTFANIEELSPCDDYVRLYSMTRASPSSGLTFTPISEKMCPDTLSRMNQKTFSISAESVYVQFKSDWWIQKKGFVIDYSITGGSSSGSSGGNSGSSGGNSGSSGDNSGSSGGNAGSSGDNSGSSGGNSGSSGGNSGSSGGNSGSSGGNGGNDAGASCGKTVTDYSLRFKDEWLNRHNTVRAAQGLVTLTWDEGLARRAQELASSCVYGHAMLTNCAGDRVGQNLYASASSDSSADPNLGAPAVQSWYDEVKDYNYNANVCNAQSPNSCGHYTQIMWRETSKIGCAAARCGRWSFWPQFDNTFFVVCNYYTGGNVNNRRPY